MEESQNKLDAIANKYTDGFEKFSNSKSGNIILDFLLFKRNLIPYTFQIVYVLGVLAVWIVAVLGIFGQLPIGGSFSGDGALNFVVTLALSLAMIVLAPFVLHYVLEIVKLYVWPFLVHVYQKVVCPIWDTLVVRFFANVFPQIFPFMYERFMTIVDIYVSKLGALLDAFIDALNALFVTIVGALKGVVWLPLTIGRRLDRWANKAKEDVTSEKAE